jgi:hypothetical protein
MADRFEGGIEYHWFGGWVGPKESIDPEPERSIAWLRVRRELHSHLQKSWLV